MKKENVFLGLVVLLSLAVTLFAFFTTQTAPLITATRLQALNGYIALAIAACMSPFLKEITLAFKKPFTKVHHYFAAAGLALITLHPIMFVIQTLNPVLFLPNLESVYLFFYYGGSVALILVYVAVLSALLRRKIATHWRPIHALMYVALFFGVVHANLYGVDLQNVAVKVVYDVLFGAAIGAFVLKRWKIHKIKTRINNFDHTNNSPAN